MGSLRLAFGSLVISGAAGAALVAAGVRVVDVGPPHDALTANVATATELATHNAIVTLWPLALVALGWPAIPAARRVGDALVAGQLLAHGAVLGSAIAQQPGLWRYLPHLPLELAALALPAAAWGTARCIQPPTTSELARTAAAVLVLVVGAAAAESYLVPLG